MMTNGTLPTRDNDPGYPPPGVTREEVLAQARALAFDLAGIATLGPAETAPYFDQWVDAGYAGEMSYLPRGAEKRADTRRPFPGALSAIVVAMNYGGTQPPGPVARYARGNDYHDVVIAKLNALHRWLCTMLNRDVRGKAYVDTGPILERDLARRAGLGWFGKNTMLIHPRLGSYVFLGALLVDLDLPPDAPFPTDYCGRCTRCLDACPTEALVAPHVLDATRCISYLTIELKGVIPEQFRGSIGELIYGCDICQEVCPYNQKFAREPSESAFIARRTIARKDARTLALALLSMSQPEFSATFKKSPIKRAKLRGLKRNAAVVLGNIAAPDTVPALSIALSDDEPIVRRHAAWALGNIGSPEALEALRARGSVEPDPWVLSEIRSALARATDPGVRRYEEP